MFGQGDFIHGLYYIYKFSDFKGNIIL